MREHDSPAGLTARGVDLGGEYVELEVRRGDPTPVEEITLEVGGEEYDEAIWADGAETIESGDRIRLRSDDVEPNLEVRLRHEMESGTSTSSTRILSHFRFDFEYDPAGRLAIEYADDFPLDGDEVYVGVVDDDRYYRGERVERAVQPWEGRELEAGDDASIDGVEPGQTIVVGYGGADFESGIARYRIAPPGHVRYDYDPASAALEATLRAEYDQPASAFELRVDGDPASVQWADEYDTIADEATIAVPDLEYGTRVSTVWGDDDRRVGSTIVLPSVDVERLADEEPAIEHVGGDAVASDELELEVWTGKDRVPVDVGAEIDGAFEEGDRIPLGVDEARSVHPKYGSYGGGHAVDRSHR